MVSDQEIASCVETLLRQSEPSAAAAAAVGANLAGVVRQVEAKLGLNLSHKAAFIRDQIDLLLGPRRLPAKDQHGQLPPPLHHLQSHNIPIHAAPAAPASAPHVLLHHLHQIPATSPFSHFASHHELAFGYAPAPPAGQALLMPAAAVAAAQSFQQQQLATAAAVRPMAAASPKEGTPAVVKRKGGPGGLSKICGVSPELQVIVGEPAMPRTQIVKQLWAYIRRNNLQDPNNKRKIICNDELRQVFETDCTDMFKMNKLLAKHIISLAPSSPDTKRVKIEDVVARTDSEVCSVRLIISDRLASFFDTQEKEMLRSEVMKRIWDYIKHNQLMDPENPMTILCDTKLHKLFRCENISASELSEMLEFHLSEKS